MKSLFIGLFLMTSLLTIPQKAFSWGDMGHEVVGEVAEQNLSADGRAFVRGILGVEPLAVAATWPDHVRDDKRFGHKDYQNPDDLIYPVPAAW